MLIGESHAYSVAVATRNARPPEPCACLLLTRASPPCCGSPSWVCGRGAPPPVTPRLLSPSRHSAPTAAAGRRNDPAQATGLGDALGDGALSSGTPDNRQEKAMSSHPAITTALAEQHRRDLTARAEAYRLTRAARSSRPAPGARAAGLARIIRQPSMAMRRAAIRLRLLRAPAVSPRARFPARFAGDLSPIRPIPVQPGRPGPRSHHVRHEQ